MQSFDMVLEFLDVGFTGGRAFGLGTGRSSVFCGRAQRVWVKSRSEALRVDAELNVYFE
jgi:hypothetical protein